MQLISTILRYEKTGVLKFNGLGWQKSVMRGGEQNNFIVKPDRATNSMFVWGFKLRIIDKLKY
jgi:hypothetical protein